MEDHYSQIQSNPQSSFAYFHPDTKLDVQQSNLAQHHDVNSTPATLLYPTQMSQSLQPFNMFSPEIPSNSVPFSQMYHNGYSGNAQLSSPYKKDQLLSSHIPPNLLIQSNIHDSDVYYYPSTPPLSASPSLSGSPSNYSALPTPVNTAIFGMQRIKDEIITDNSGGPNWLNYDSPPVTPAYVQSGMLIGNGNSHDLVSIQRPTNSPSASPLPSQLPTEPENDFCDPRKLTVCPGVHQASILEESEPLLNVNHLPPRESSEEQKHLVRTTTPRIFNSKDVTYLSMPQPIFHNLDQSTELDVGDNIFCGFPNYSIPDASFYLTTKRQRTDSGISMTNGPIINPCEFHELDESGSYSQFAVACPLSPPSSIPERDRKNAKRSKKLKKMASELPLQKDNNESDIQFKPESYSSESKNDDKNTKSTDTSSSGVSEKSKLSDLSKTQQVTRRGRKQSETEDLTKTFVCESCNRRFKRQEHLKRHYRSVHTQEKPFKCHECGKDFSRSDNLSQHARTHGNGSIVVGLLEEAEMSSNVSANCEHIGNLGSILFNVAAAAPGSETDRSSQCSSNGSSNSKDGQSRKKRRRPE